MVYCGPVLPLMFMRGKRSVLARFSIAIENYMRLLLVSVVLFFFKEEEEKEDNRSQKADFIELLSYQPIRVV